MLKVACEANQQSFKRDVLTFMTLTYDLFRSTKDMVDFEDLSMERRDELTEVFLDRRRPTPGKRRAVTAGGKEFPDGQDWSRLSGAQLRRACVERMPPVEGMALLPSPPRLLSPPPPGSRIFGTVEQAR